MFISFLIYILNLKNENNKSKNIIFDLSKEVAAEDLRIAQINNLKGTEINGLNQTISELTEKLKNQQNVVSNELSTAKIDSLIKYFDKFGDAILPAKAISRIIHEHFC